MGHFIELFEKKTSKNVRNDPRALEKFRREAEKAKQKLTRTKFQELNMDLFQSTLKPVEKVLENANMKKSDIDEIILVGGSTRIPKIRQMVNIVLITVKDKGSG